MTAISVLVPYRPDGGYRDRNWEWNERRWRALFPSCELVVETDDGGSSPAEFNHPRALNRAAARASGDFFVVADVDIVPDPAWLARAAQAIEKGARWCVCSEYLKLGARSSEEITQGEPSWPLPPINGLGLAEAPVLFSCAPPLLISREGFKASGGYEERIAWWGADDAIFRICADTLWGLMERVEGSALHLWHPEANLHHERQEEQQQLVWGFEKAAGDKDAVLALRA